MEYPEWVQKVGVTMTAAPTPAELQARRTAGKTKGGYNAPTAKDPGLFSGATAAELPGATWDRVKETADYVTPQAVKDKVRGAVTGAKNMAGEGLQWAGKNFSQGAMGPVDERITRVEDLTKGVQKQITGVEDRARATLKDYEGKVRKTLPWAVGIPAAAAIMGPLLGSMSQPTVPRGVSPQMFQQLMNTQNQMLQLMRQRRAQAAAPAWVQSVGQRPLMRQWLK